MARLGAQGVPTFLVGDELIIGFDKNRLSSLLFDRVVACPKCRAKLRLPSGKGTLRVTCSQCGDRFETST